MADLVKDLRLRSFFISENVGFAAGGTVGHSLGHLVALGIVPERLERVLQNAIALRRRVGRSFFEEVIAFERDRQVRWVKGGKHVAAWCPYASEAPYSVALVPFRDEPVFHEIGDEELEELAGLMASLVPVVSDLTDEAPLQIRLVTAPPHWGEEPAYAGLSHAFRWQVEIVPAVFPEGGNERASGVRVNPVLPEVAGAALRAALS
jgi:UDPglucose--hexose-1-phosphate uridylyltransferase